MGVAEIVVDCFDEKRSAAVKPLIAVALAQTKQPSDAKPKISVIPNMTCFAIKHPMLLKQFVRKIAPNALTAINVPPIKNWRACTRIAPACGFNACSLSAFPMKAKNAMLAPPFRVRKAFRADWPLLTTVL